MTKNYYINYDADERQVLEEALGQYIDFGTPHPEDADAAWDLLLRVQGKTE